MIEEGITQAASLQLCATCSNIVTTIGHAFFSPNRLQADISDYESLIYPAKGQVTIPNRPGLGIPVKQEVLQRFTKNHVVVTVPT